MHFEGMTKQGFCINCRYSMNIGERVWIVQVGSDEHSWHVCFICGFWCFPLPRTSEAIPEKIWKQSTMPWRRTRHTSDSCTRMPRRTISNHSPDQPLAALHCRWIKRALYYDLCARMAWMHGWLGSVADRSVWNVWMHISEFLILQSDIIVSCMNWPYKPYSSIYMWLGGLGWCQGAAEKALRNRMNTRNSGCAKNGASKS